MESFKLYAGMITVVSLNPESRIEKCRIIAFLSFDIRRTILCKSEKRSFVWLWIRSNSPWRLILKLGDIGRPSCSTGLTSLDFFLRDYLKGKMNAGNHRTFNEFKKIICVEIIAIAPGMPEKVMINQQKSSMCSVQ